MVADLVSKPGGVLLIAITVEPSRRNYPEVSFALFDAAERAALRRALETCRKKRQKTTRHNRQLCSNEHVM